MRMRILGAVRILNLGDSRGHWEGNTLVIETTNYALKNLITGSQAERAAAGRQ